MEKVLYICVGLIILGIVISIIKKTAKYIIVLGIFLVLTLALIGAGLRNKPLQELTADEWKEVTISQYNKYKDQIENSAEAQAIYNEMVTISNGIMDTVKEEAMRSLMKQLQEELGEEGYRMTDSQNGVSEEGDDTRD
jgi:uncharacterized membrane protein YfhO